MYRKVELLFAASPIVLGLAAIIGAYLTIALPTTAYTFDPVGPRGFAYVVGAMLVILGVILLAETVKLQQASGGIGTHTDRDPEDAGDDMRYPASSWRAFAMMGLTLAFAMLINPIGYIAASILLIAAGLLVMGIRAWKTILLFSVSYALVTYLLFHTLLGVRLPAGVIERLLATLGA
jgi:putative tricarboxylic transport membrane protein